MEPSEKNSSELLSDDGTARYLAEIFRACTDEELLARYADGTLTEMARSVAAEEIRSRGLELPPLPGPDDDWEADGKYDESIDLGDLQPISPCVTPTEALLLRARLEACGIPVLLRDENLGQAFPMASSALNRLLVPESCFAQALDIIERIRAGAFALDEHSQTDILPPRGPEQET